MCQNAFIIPLLVNVHSDVTTQCGTVNYFVVSCGKTVDKALKKPLSHLAKVLAQGYLHIPKPYNHTTKVRLDVQSYDFLYHSLYISTAARIQPDKYIMILNSKACVDKASGALTKNTASSVNSGSRSLCCWGLI